MLPPAMPVPRGAWYRPSDGVRRTAALPTCVRAGQYPAAMLVRRVADLTFQLISPDEQAITKIIFLDMAGRDASRYIASFSPTPGIVEAGEPLAFTATRTEQGGPGWFVQVEMVGGSKAVIDLAVEDRLP
jgi:hypothetical protein